jgi:predicted transcriptional regulator
MNMHNIPLQKKYRNHLEIIASMLEAVKGRGARRFSIMRRTSVNSAQLKKFLGSLTELGLVEIDTEGERAVYKATDRGIEFLKHYNILQRIMWNGNL